MLEAIGYGAGAVVDPVLVDHPAEAILLGPPGTGKKPFSDLSRGNYR
jgi:hypothetical protein